MDKVDHIEVLLLTERNYPVSKIKLPLHLIEDINNFVEVSQKKDPTITEAEVVRAIWRLGSRALRNNLSKGILPRVKDLPSPLPVPEKPEPEKPNDGTGENIS